MLAHNNALHKVMSMKTRFAEVAQTQIHPPGHLDLVLGVMLC